MKSIFMGNGIGGTKHHLVHYFDGQRVREVSVITYQGEIYWTDTLRTLGILEPGTNYKAAKRKLAAYEEHCTRRIG